MRFITRLGPRQLSKSTKYLVKWNSPSRSKFQTEVKKVLKLLWNADVVLEEMPVLTTRMTIDFYNATRKIALEVDGHQHTKFSFFHGGDREKFRRQLMRDNEKEEYCRRNGIKMVRILESEKSKLSKKFLEELIERDYD